MEILLVRLFFHLNGDLKTFKERGEYANFHIVGDIKKYVQVQRILEDWENIGEVIKYHYGVL